MSEQLLRLMKKKNGDVFNLALSGGETAKQMFHWWCCEYRHRIPWQQIHFFWVDKRCVPLLIRKVITEMPINTCSARY